MGTIIENINALSKIKYDLKTVLVENGQRGGEVFSEYPEQFRDLFRVLEDYVDHTNMGYSPQAYSVQSIVPTPEMYYDENIVFIHCDMQQATIKYWIVTESGKNNQGEITLKGNTIMVTEACTVYCYAEYRRNPSATAELFVPYYPEIVPDDPVITREGTTITITCATTTATIYYKLNEGGEYQIYTGPVENVPRTVDVYSFAQDYRGRSYEVKDEAPEKPVKPATPVLTFANNTITITCETTGATIYYMKEGGYWYEYTGPITITSADNGYYYTKSIKDYIESDISDRVWCEYSEEPVVVIPADPVISCSNNVVTITCSTSGATIYYSTDGGNTYDVYNGPITISADTTFYAYSELNGETSNVVGPYEADYEEEPQPVAPADPVISCTNNVVTITCSTSGAAIWYSTDGGNTYSIYSGTIPISANTTFYAYSTKDGLISNVVGPYNATYVPQKPANPVISCTNNIVTITCSTPGATIMYKTGSTYIQYNGPFEIYSTMYVYAKSIKDNLESSIVRKNIYIPNSPSFDIDEENMVYIINTDDREVSIYYSTNGTNYTLYDSPITISADTTFYAYSRYNDNNSTTVTYNAIYQGEPDYPNLPLTFKILTNGTIGWKCYNLTNGKTIEYNKNDSGWTSIRSSSSGNNISVVKGDIIRFRGENTNYGTDSFYNWYNYFTSSCQFNIYGNILSLVNLPYGSPDTYTFSKLFINCNGLRSAKNLILPSTFMQQYCYREMFEDCTYLSEAPALPATNLAYGCYYGMFKNCISLITTPELPALTLVAYCYEEMFNGCTGLTTAPSLPATTLAKSCYHAMFGYCYSLTNTPLLPVTTLAPTCYAFMFNHCTSLTTAPVLPATNLTDANGCYESMFWGCTALTTAPALPATTLSVSCYYEMFWGCTALTTAPALPATVLTESCYAEMFLECRNLVNIPTNLNATTLARYCCVAMFKDCKSLTTAPILPATNLAYGCYSEMFRGCSLLTTAPDLPASTLVSLCYESMFRGCYNLNYIKCLATNTTNAGSYLQYWVSGVSSRGTFVKYPNTSWSTASYVNDYIGIPANWTVQEASS